MLPHLHPTPAQQRILALVSPPPPLFNPTASTAPRRQLPWLVHSFLRGPHPHPGPAQQDYSPSAVQAGRFPTSKPDGPRSPACDDYSHPSRSSRKLQRRHHINSLIQKAKWVRSSRFASSPQCTILHKNATLHNHQPPATNHYPRRATAPPPPPPPPKTSIAPKATPAPRYSNTRPAPRAQHSMTNRLA
jgi:hypothetical protein